MDISVVGLGKLGAPLAAVLADRGHHVTGVDVNPAAVRALAAGEPPVQEPGLAELLARSRDRLTATTDAAAAVAATTVTFVIVPTPSEPDGAFSMRFATAAAETIGAALAAKPDYHLVVLTSTVMPGATAGEFVPALETASGKQCGRDFGVCYSPEFIALGTVVRDLLEPDFVLIGESDRRAGDVLESLYRTVHAEAPPMRRMTFANAELTKLAVNAFVTMKISFANMLAQICETLPGGDVDTVTDAVGADSRVGRKFLKGATGFGGPCFPRDNSALARVAETCGVAPHLPRATDAVNRDHTTRLAARIAARVPAGGRVGVLGLAYKPGTWVIEESAGVAIVQELLARALDVVVYDPAALAETRRLVGNRVTYAPSAAACVAAADVVVVATPWPEFRNVEFNGFASTADRKRTLVDCWRVLDAARLDGVVEYDPLGVGARQEETV